VEGAYNLHNNSILGGGYMYMPAR